MNQCNFGNFRCIKYIFQIHSQRNYQHKFYKFRHPNIINKGFHILNIVNLINNTHLYNQYNHFMNYICYKSDYILHIYFQIYNILLCIYIILQSSIVFLNHNKMYNNLYLTYMLDKEINIIHNSQNCLNNNLVYINIHFDLIFDWDQNILNIYQINQCRMNIMMNTIHNQFRLENNLVNINIYHYQGEIYQYQCKRDKYSHLLNK